MVPDLSIPGTRMLNLPYDLGSIFMEEEAVLLPGFDARMKFRTERR